MELTLYNSFPEGLEAEWNDLLDRTAQHVPFLRHEYLSIWWQTLGGGEWDTSSDLTIVAARRNGKLVGIAPLFQNKDRLLILGSIEISDYLDLMAAPEDLTDFIDELFPYLAEKISGWKSLDLYNILEDSPSLPVLQHAARKMGWAYHLEDYLPSPYLSLPDTWDAYLADIDKKQRHEIRRKLRRTENAEVPVKWMVVEKRDELNEAVEQFMTLMRWDEKKTTFLTEPMQQFIHQVAICAFESGCLHLSFLEIGGEKAAGYFCFDYLDRMWVYNSGMSLDFREYSAGWVALSKLIQWSIAHGRKELDFMRGDEDYKYRFGGINRHVMHMLIKRT